MTSPNRRTLAIGLAAAVAATAVAIPAADAKKKPVKPQPNSAYASSIAAKRGFAVIVLSKGKIISGTIRAKFKDADGKVCRQEGVTLDNGQTQMDYTIGKPKKPNGKGKYSVKGTVYDQPSDTATFSGKFASSTKTSIVVKAKWMGCKTGKVVFKKAVPTMG
ncbi:MAG TPA: hypothetical protein VFQ14_03980 [Thermoleophilaceae bacterium]|nr:hypothetical protein [Thermoleophilaceae bacterium]